ncbi:MAG: NAD(P)/FAD-dependent oxidoreductase [Planctomycetota bacterium]|jgi:NADPH-dependent 2,4-dienoyl-CoA reductase/sulfur reductase-like enzyme|nr:NAD(P)/FAD-dependent oxidoreductase [Planctomycetota bacterium]
MKHDVVVIGGGPTGLAAACAAGREGAGVLIIERDIELGGILNQCIHNGFGLHYFKEELTGPEYAERFIRRVEDARIKVKLDTMVLEITRDRRIKCVNGRDGYQEIEAGAIVLCMGCRERTRGAIALPGTRPAGVLTAGTAQRYVNLEGYMVGKRVIILGSGDIGLIMARRLTLEGAKVLACVEVMPYSGGLKRNIAQCLDDYGIPLYLSHAIIDIVGERRVEKVVVSKVDEIRRPIPGTEIEFACDTVLLSIGLIPENELTRAAFIEMDRRTGGPMVYENMETSIRGIFAAGNAVHVHDLVDFVTLEGDRAGRAAALRAGGGGGPDGPVLAVRNGDRVTYTIPQRVRPGGINGAVDLFFRVSNEYRDMEIRVMSGEDILCRFGRAFLAPGEMEKISVPRRLLEKTVSGFLTICAAPRREKTA